MSRKKTPIVILHDRYSATGTPRPGPDSCKTCEGMGFHPTKCDCRGTKPNHKPDELLKTWCFVQPCQACNGTRKTQH